MKKVLEIKVIPGAKTEEVIEGDPLVVKVKEKAEKGKANEAVIKLLSRYFKAKVRIIRGEKSRHKLVEIDE
ncbi:DUF167 domain-containing protein [bacterium]|nr:DUF167 domain-containing protein [bacterium]